MQIPLYATAAQVEPGSVGGVVTFGFLDSEPQPHTLTDFTGRISILESWRVATQTVELPEGAFLDWSDPLGRVVWFQGAFRRDSGAQTVNALAREEQHGFRFTDRQDSV